MAETTVLYSGTAGLPAGVTRITSAEFDLGGFTTTDIFQVVKLPAGSLILGALMEITESAGETCTVDVGPAGGSADVILSNVDMNQVAGTLAIATQGTNITGHVPFAAATVINVTADGGTTYAAGKGKVHLLVGMA